MSRHVVEIRDDFIIYEDNVKDCFNRVDEMAEYISQELKRYIPIHNIDQFIKTILRFSKENDMYTFKEDILFDENTYSQSLLKFLEIFKIKNKVLIFKIFNYYTDN